MADANEVSAKLRSKLEKGEAVRQSIEFEMAKLRKEIVYQKRIGEEKETLLSDMNEGLKGEFNFII